MKSTLSYQAMLLQAPQQVTGMNNGNDKQDDQYQCRALEKQLIINLVTDKELRKHNVCQQNKRNGNFFWLSNSTLLVLAV